MDTHTFTRKLIQYSAAHCNTAKHIARHTHTHTHTHTVTHTVLYFLTFTSSSGTVAERRARASSTPSAASGYSSPYCKLSSINAVIIILMEIRSGLDYRRRMERGREREREREREMSPRCLLPFP